MSAKVAVLDYGCGNVRSAVRALERVGAGLELTARRDIVLEADGLVVPGVGAFGACLTALQSVHGGELIGRRLAGAGRSSGICVGMQVLFDAASNRVRDRSRAWPNGPVRWSGWRRPWSRTWGGARCSPPRGTRLLRGVEPKSASTSSTPTPCGGWELVHAGRVPDRRPKVTWAEHGDRFVAAVENGPLSATQFHPEKSGDAGAACSRTGSWALMSDRFRA